MRRIYKLDRITICIAIVMVLVNSLRLYGFGLAEILLGFAVLGSLVVIHILGGCAST